MAKKKEQYEGLRKLPEGTKAKGSVKERMAGDNDRGLEHPIKHVGGKGNVKAAKKKERKAGEKD